MWNMFKVNNKDISVFFANFEDISHLILVFLLLTLNMYLPAGKLPANSNFEVFRNVRNIFFKRNMRAVLSALISFL